MKSVANFPSCLGVFVADNKFQSNAQGGKKNSNIFKRFGTVFEYFRMVFERFCMVFECFRTFQNANLRVWFENLHF